VALTRGGRRVWDELGHWLSLDQTWEAVTALKYRVSMRNLTRWEKLAAPTKRAAADLRMLHGELAEEAPFTVTQSLAEAITMQVTNVQPISGRARRMEWLQPLADGLCRAKLRDEAATGKVREVARRLLNTTWQTVSRLEVTPYIDGTPARRTADAESAVGGNQTLLGGPSHREIDARAEGGTDAPIR
jgi:hypothetical protein